MHRSCFALMVLFTVIAGSLLSVRSARAQSPWCAFLNHPASNNNSAATGYDDAYDSAMFDDEYPVLDEAQAQVNDNTVENVGAAKCHEIPMHTCLGAGNSLSFDGEYACEQESHCLDGVVCPLARTGYSDTDSSGTGDTSDMRGAGETADSAVVNSGDGSAGAGAGEDAGSEVTGTTEDGEAVGPVGAAASADESADLRTVHNFLWNTITGTVHDIGQFARTYGSATWPSIVWQRPDAQEWLVTVTEAAQEAWESSSAPTYVQQQYSEEIVMLHVANSLDHIADQLQEAAHFLRFKAADRIVSKGQRRRVANR